MGNQLADVKVGVVINGRAWRRVIQTDHCDGHAVLFVKHRYCNNPYNCAIHLQFLLILFISYNFGLIIADLPCFECLKSNYYDRLPNT